MFNIIVRNKLPPFYTKLAAFYHDNVIDHY
jgi:hypothetical protein